MVLQLFVVSRVVKYLGVPVALCIVPLVALGSYATAALIPSLAIMRWVKTAENSVDYSLMNTVRQMLFLPTTREEKYKAKQVIDSFVVRAGDVLAAVTVYLGTTFFALSVSQFAWINVALVLVWLILAVLTGREFQRRTVARQRSAAVTTASRAPKRRGRADPSNASARLGAVIQAAPLRRIPCTRSSVMSRAALLRPSRSFSRPRRCSLPAPPRRRAPASTKSGSSR